MIAFIVRRIAHALLVLFVVSVLAFLLGALVGDPVASILGLGATPADRDALRLRLGLDDPLPARYFAYLGRVLSGDFGVSYATQRIVTELIWDRAPATFELAAVALCLSLAIGVPLGVYAALNRGRFLAGVLMAVSLIGVSLPTFVVGLLLIFGFAVSLGWLPSFGRGAVIDLGWWKTGLLTASGLKSLILPAISLAIGQVALVARLVRAEMAEVLRADFIRFARARGLKARAVNFAHALRNTMIPLITVSGIQLGYLVAFAVVVESVFQWPGLGLLFIEALSRTDTPVISAFLMLAAFFFVSINFIVDCLYLIADPRLRVRAVGGR